MKPRTTLVLLIMVIVGIAYIGLIDNRIPSSDQRQALSGRMLRFDPNRVSRIEIEHGRKRILCERRDGEWFVVEPYAARADNAVINRIIAGAHRMEHFVTITRKDREEGDLSLADYGLLPPKAIVRIEGDGFKNLINLGHLSLDSEMLYVALDNTKQNIFGVNSDILDQIPLNFFEYRSRNVFDFDKQSINRIEVKTETHGFVSLSLNRSGHWVMTQPYEARLARRKVETLIERILDLEFIYYMEEIEADDTLHGFDEVDLSISLRSDQDLLAREVLFGSSLGSDEPASYARYRSDQSLFTVSTSLISELLDDFDPERLRDRSILLAPTEAIEALRIGSGSQALEFELKDGRWSMVSPRRWRAERSLIEGLIADWKDASILDFLAVSEDEEPIDFDMQTELAFGVRRPRRTDEERGDMSWTKLETAERDPSLAGLPVRRNDEPWVYVVDIEKDLDLPTNPLHYRDRTVLSIPSENVQRINLRRDDREQAIVRSGEDDSFEIENQDSPASRTILDPQRLMELIANLRCVRYIRTDSDAIADYGLEQPRASLTLVLRGDAGISNTVVIGNQNEDGLYYARVRGQDTAFLLDLKSVGIILSDLYITIENE